jgi:hypothetical protein
MVRLVSRRQEFAKLVPNILGRGRAPMTIAEIYRCLETDHPELIDDEIEPGPGHVVRWKHDLRWEIETLVVAGTVKRRKDLGRGFYSA